MLTPYLQVGVIQVDAIRIVLRDALKSLGYSADELVDDPEAEQQYVYALGPQAGGAQPAPGLPGPGTQMSLPPSSAPGTPPPALDGRSAAPPSPGDSANLRG